METSKKKTILPKPRKKASGDYRHGDLHAAVLDAAAQFVAQRGGPEFTLREIAQRVGVQHTAIYRHFASKEAIVAALATRAFNQLLGRFQQAERACGQDVRAYLESLADEYFVTVRDDPGAYRVMFARTEFEDPERNRASQQCFEALVGAFARGQCSGLVRDDLPPVALAATNWAAMHGLALLQLDQRLEDEPKFGSQSMLHQTLRSVLREGWLSQQPPKKSTGRSKSPKSRTSQRRQK